MEKPKKASEKNEIREIVDKNTRIIQALKNLNQKICSESKLTGLPEPETPDEPRDPRLIQTE